MAINILDLELREPAHSHVKEATGGSEASSEESGQLGPADRAASDASSTGNDGQYTPPSSTEDYASSSTTPPESSSTPDGVGVDSTATSIDSASLTSLPSESATPSDIPTTTSDTLTATPTSTSDDTGADSAGSSAHGMTDAETTAAIAVPVIDGSLLIIAALVWFFLRRRRRQRESLPSYAPSPGQTPVVSTAKLTDAPPVVPAQEPPAVAATRLPLLDAPETSTSGDDRSPLGSAGQTSARSAHVDDHEVGLAVSGPVHQRQATTEQDQHRESRAASLADTMAQPMRLPFQDTADDDDAVSVVSGMNEGRGRERDLDDMSSVSSFDGDEDRDAHARGHQPSR